MWGQGAKQEDKVVGDRNGLPSKRTPEIRQMTHQESGKKAGETKATEVEVNYLQRGKKSTTIVNVNKDKKGAKKK